jgi:hypothetical protein
MDFFIENKKFASCAFQTTIKAFDIHATKDLKFFLIWQPITEGNTLNT